ncbi:MAG: type II CAAX endopeptidase family protein [Eubacteriales bacterium]|nr:type II CAAX endopeptidase family protein [Eubacteriales bacterium]
MKSKYSFAGAGWLLCIWLVWYQGVMGVFGLATAMGLSLTSTWSYYLVTGVLEILLIAPVVGYALVKKAPAASLMGARPRGGQIALGAAIGVCLVPATMFVSIFWQAILQALGGGQLEMNLPAAGNLGELLLGMAVMGGTAAIVEEPLFRGIVLRGAGARLPKWPALILTSVLFGLCHFQHQSLPTLILVGLALGLVTWRTGSLWPSIALHGTYNMTAVLLEFVSQKASALVGSELTDAGAVSLPQMLLGGLSWLAIGVPFAAAIAGLYYWLCRITPKRAVWKAQPWETKPGAWGWVPWVLAGLIALGGVTMTALQDFGFFNWLMELANRIGAR